MLGKSIWVALICSAAIPAEHNPRFTGSGTLQAAIAVTTDGRFALKADLQAASVPVVSGRFSVRANLRPHFSTKELITDCSAADDQLFQNGFE